MAEHGLSELASWRVSEYEGSQEACAGPLGGAGGGEDERSSEGEKSGSIIPVG